MGRRRTSQRGKRGVELCWGRVEVGAGVRRVEGAWPEQVSLMNPRESTCYGLSGDLCIINIVGTPGTAVATAVHLPGSRSALPPFLPFPPVLSSPLLLSPALTFPPLLPFHALNSTITLFSTTNNTYNAKKQRKQETNTYLNTGAHR